MKNKKIKVDTLVDAKTEKKLKELADKRFLGNRRIAVKHCIEYALNNGAM